MRAPAKVHRALLELGFGFDRDYFRLSETPRIAVIWQIDRGSRGLLLQPDACWLFRDDFAMMVSPLELDVLRTDGSIGGIPLSNDVGAFWDPRDTAGMIEAIRGPGELHLQRMADPQVMIPVFDFLLGLPVDPPEAFPVLRSSWVERHTSPNRFRARAAFCVAAGRFDEAISTIARIPERSISEFDLSMLEAARSRNLEIPESSIKFLRSIGAAVP